MTVGAGEIFKKVVIGWPRTGEKSTPGEEQMMISRTKEYTDFAIYEEGKGMAITIVPFEEEVTAKGGGNFEAGFDLIVNEYRNFLQQEYSLA